MWEDGYFQFYVKNTVMLAFCVSPVSSGFGSDFLSGSCDMEEKVVLGDGEMRWFQLEGSLCAHTRCQRAQ